MCMWLKRSAVPWAFSIIAPSGPLRYPKPPFRLACAPLALWIPLAPLLVALILAWVASQGLRRTWLGESALTHPATSWSARLGLAVIFGFSVVDLGSDATALM